MSGLQGPFIQLEMEDELETRVRIGRGRQSPRKAYEPDVQHVLVQVEDKNTWPRIFEIPIVKARELLQVLEALL